MNKYIRPTENKQQALERLWTELVSRSPAPQEYLDIIRCVPELRERAWAKFAESNPSKEDLMNLVRDHNWRISQINYPGSLLLKLYPDDQTLIFVMSEVVSLRNEVAKVALKRNTGSCQLLSAILSKVNDPELLNSVAERIFELNPTYHELYIIVVWVPKYSEKAGLLILDSNLEDVLIPIILDIYARVPSLRGRVWSMLKNRSCRFWELQQILHIKSEYQFEIGSKLLQSQLTDSNRFDALFSVAVNAPVLREDVWKELKNITMSNVQLEALIRDIPELADRARARLVTPVRDVNVVVDEILCVNNA